MSDLNLKINLEGPKKKIALVANTTWNIYNFRQNIIKILLQKGHEVYVLAPIDEFIEYKEKYPTVKHIGLRGLDRDSTNPIKDLVLIEELRRKYKRIKPDLIIHYTHKPNIFGSIAAAINGYHSISIVTGLGYSFINKGLIQSITKKLYTLSNRYTKKVIFENKDDLKLFVDQGMLSAKKGISVKGCGVDLTYYVPQARNSVNGEVIFTFIGRLLVDKGVKEFVQAANILKKSNPHLKFVILGDFDQKNPSTIIRDELLDWINQDIIEYHGFVKDVRSYISNSDCIVLPSYREGLPRIVIEGMAMGKPIITTDTAGCRDTVDHLESGFIIEAKNTDALVEGVKSFLKLSKEERNLMGDKGRMKAQQEFSDTVIAENIYQIILPLLNRNT